MSVVLVVDDMEENVQLLARMLMADGHTVVTAADGVEAVDVVRSRQPDLVLMDVRMPRLNGFEACHQIKQDAALRLTPVVLVTGLSDAQSRIRGIDAGADDFLSKPVNEHELRARVRSLLRIKSYTDDLDTAESVIISLAMTIEARDVTTDGHCRRLAAYGLSLGRALGLTEEDLAALDRAAYLHDIGKVGIPDSVLLKPGPLTAEEFDVMKQHTLIGDRLCGELRSLRRERPIVRHHHERLDGSGYPDGLRGEAIPLLAQLMGIVDVYDALRTVRPYKAALPFAAAAAELRGEAARGLHNPALVSTFLALEEPRVSLAPDDAH